MELKHIISDLRDNIYYITKDVSYLADAVNALLKGHEIHNTRIAGLERINETNIQV